MRKLMLVKRADRVACASADTLKECQLRAPVVRVGDVVMTMPELKIGVVLSGMYEERDGIPYIFAMTKDEDEAAFVIPREDVQDIPDADSISAIIFILMQ